jgi:hypothetical protein
MQEVLVDCSQFIGKLRVEQLDNIGVTFHGILESDVEDGLLHFQLSVVKVLAQQRTHMIAQEVQNMIILASLC